MDSAALSQQSNLAILVATMIYLLAFLAYGAFMGARVDTATRRKQLVDSTGDTVTTDGSAASPDGETLDDTDPPPADPSAPGKRTFADRASGIATALTAVAAVLHLVAVGFRAAATGRVPWGNMYEFATTGSLIVVAAYFLVLAKPRLVGLPADESSRWLGVFLIGPVLLTVWSALGFWYTDASELRPALQDGLWMVVHVFTATVSSALFTVAFCVTLVQLAKMRFDDPDNEPGWFSRIPSATVLEQVSYRLHAAAFPMWVFVLISGAIWAQDAWGRYWGWDAKEVWSFITFVVYAAYLHARATGGWSRRAGWLAVAGFLCLMMNFGIVNVFFPGLHSYSGLTE